MVLMASDARAQDALGQANPKASESIARLAYMVGEWELTSYVRNEDGVFKANPKTSFFRARYLHDGYSVMNESYGEDPNGFYGVNIITYDATSEELIFSFFNAKRSRRVEFMAAFEGDDLHIWNQGGYQEKGDYLYRETDTEITNDAFIKRLHRSDDGGKTWVEGDYYFAYKRIR